MKVAAIIAAAGIGKRMGGVVPKQYLELAGKPVICHTLDCFREARTIDTVIIVVEPGRENSFRNDILKEYGYPPSWKVVAGGKARQESVSNGMQHVSLDCDVVIIHDGVRPFVTVAQIKEAVSIAAREGACILAVPLKETVKRVGMDDTICETVDREYLWGAQTPQCFRRDIFSDALAQAIRERFVGTDEASLVERVGGRIAILLGDARNIKITTPEDLIIAEAMLKATRTAGEL